MPKDSTTKPRTTRKNPMRTCRGAVVPRAPTPSPAVAHADSPRSEKILAHIGLTLAQLLGLTDFHHSSLPDDAVSSPTPSMIQDSLDLERALVESQDGDPSRHASRSLDQSAIAAEDGIHFSNSSETRTLAPSSMHVTENLQTASPDRICEMLQVAAADGLFAFINAVAELVTTCDKLAAEKWDPRSLVWYIIVQMRLRDANPLAIRGIRVRIRPRARGLVKNDRIAFAANSHSSWKVIFKCALEVDVLVKDELFYRPFLPDLPETVRAYSVSSSSTTSSCSQTPTRDIEEEDHSEPQVPPTSSTSSSENGHLIKRPKGQAGRPGRGGYNLLQTLGWSNMLYRSVREMVQQSASIHLDQSESYKHQDPRAVDLVCRLACKLEPRLLDYENTWPVHDILMTSLSWAKRHRD